MIEIHNLTKRYGSHIAVDDAGLVVPAGVVLGLIGPQGSGKSTLLKILATLIEPTSGDAFIDGASVVNDRQRVRQIVGYLPDDFGVYPELTCTEDIEFFASCYGVPAGERATLVNDLLQLVDLHHRKDVPADRLTRGMKQRLGIARMLAHDPRVLLFDELLTPLDPRARVETRELLRELSGMGKTIVITGASVAEVQDVCTHIAMIREGKINQLGAFVDATADSPPHRFIQVKFLGDTDLATRLLRDGRGVVDVQVVLAPTGVTPAPTDALVGIALLKELRVTFNGDYADASALLRSLMHSGVQVVAFSEEA